MLQQKIHRERLEEISRQKEEEMQSRNVVYYENTPQQSQQLHHNNLDLLIQNQQNELSRLLYLNINPALTPNMPTSTNHIQHLTTPTQIVHKSENISKQVDENEVNLENLASLVYEKLIIKKSEEKKQKSFNSNDISNASITSVKQENERYLVDLICDENSQVNKKQINNKSIKTLVKKCPKAPTKLDSKHFLHTNEIQDMEESKLIEELFFI